MHWQGWLTLGIVASLLVVLALTSVSADVAFLGGLAILLLAGVINAGDALAGFGNEGVATVAVMFVVVRGLRETGAIGWIAAFLLGKPHSIAGAQIRMMAPVAVLSAFMNNTPLVAMMIPAVGEWAKRYRLPVSKLMMPLSFATVLGGLCTLIGTSTNLVVNGLVIKAYRENATGLDGLADGFRFFEPAWVGVPCTIVGLAYLIAVGRWLLPDRGAAISQLSNPREYTVEMLVDDHAPLVGRTVEQAGLRHLPGAFLVEIERGGDILSAVAPDERLLARDRLVFAGIVESVVDLQKIRGLKPATDQVFKLDAPRGTRCLVEAAVSDTHPGVGQTIRDSRFRSTYRAVVIAVARNGERIKKKIGDIVLRPGDTLLLETDSSFIESQRNSRDFLLISPIGDSTPPRHERAWVAILILATMVLAASIGLLDMFPAALAAACLMVLTRCCTASAARQSIDIALLAAIAASFGMSRALEKTGAAALLSDNLLGFSGGHPWLALLAVYLATSLVTEVLSNNAAAVLMFPIALAAARKLDVSALPFTIGVMIAATAAFATPIGYQTHLMVYGPGGYRFSDYLKIGIPLDLVIALVAVGTIPFVWPF